MAGTALAAFRESVNVFLFLFVNRNQMKLMYFLVNVL
jgi:hypothetical protein